MTTHQMIPSLYRSRYAPLTISSLTLGDVPFEVRTRAAACAGFGAIGLRVEDYTRAASDGLDDAAMIAILQHYGIRVQEVEFLVGWHPINKMDSAQRQRELTLFHMARTFRVPHVNTGLFGSFPIAEICPSFQALCDRAAEIDIAFEYMPFGAVKTLSGAWDLIVEAQRSNARLLIDTWHWARSGTTVDELARIDPRAVAAVQLADVALRAKDSLVEESRHYRVAPGEGVGGVIGILKAIAAHGVRPLYCVEVPSDELRSRGAEAAAAANFMATERVMSQLSRDI